MIQFHIGCSGFYYNHWKGLFYPEDLPKSKWFGFYTDQFNTLELNVTFYRFPKLSTFESWHQKSPAHFSFAVKAPRLITHYKQFHDTAEIMQGYYATMQEGLKDKLGPVLFQLPPRADYTEERLERILETLDPAFQNVLEFRHISWWNETVYSRLAMHKISFCGMSHPLLPDEVIQNAPLVYYRLHGVPDLYRSLYSLQKIQHIARQILDHSGTREAYLYFNNDIGGSAITNALQLKKYIESKQQPKK